MKKLKLLVYGEGPTDYGWVSDSGTWCPGPIISLIRKSAEVFQVELEIGFVEKKAIEGEERVQLGARHMRGINGKGIPALRLARRAHDFAENDRMLVTIG